MVALPATGLVAMPWRGRINDPGEVVSTVSDFVSS